MESERTAIRKVDWVGYFVALLSVGVAVFVRWLLDAMLGDRLPFQTLYGGVAVAVWFGGARPATAAAVCGFLVCTYVFVPPRGEFMLDKPAIWVSAIGYTLSIGIIIWLGHAMRAAKERAETHSARLEIEMAERRHIEVALAQERETLSAAKELAESASRTKDDFLAALSHELRTPLTPVLMTAAALRKDETLPPELRQQLAMIERNVALEARLIDDLLDLTRITRGKLTLRQESCDAHSLIGLVVDMVRGEAKEKSIDIVLDLSARRHRVEADPARLQQVLWNLLRNAVKFTPRGGSVRLRSYEREAEIGSAAEPGLGIEVSDNGVGFEPGVAERIFEPFEQGATSPEQKFGGLGLGLAIARAVVELHHGIIRAESAGLGKGARFTVELPGALHAEESAADRDDATGDARRGATASEPPMRLLVVEDHESTLQVLARLLTRAGHSIVTATNLAEARRAAQQHTFDAVVSDLGLPDGTGMELMEELRARYGLRGIALSGYGMDEDVRRSREAGFVAHLTKPVDIQDLRTALRRLAAPAA